jgi:hypothetical protein
MRGKGEEKVNNLGILTEKKLIISQELTRLQKAYSNNKALSLKIQESGGDLNSFLYVNMGWHEQQLTPIFVRH